MKPVALAQTVAFLAYSTLALAQTSIQTAAETARTTAPVQAGTLAIEGHQTTVPLAVLNGRFYVDVEALARLTSGSLTSKGNAVTLTLPASAASPSASADSKASKPQFSPNFLRAGIEAMTDIREWRAAIVNAVQNNQPVLESWASSFRRAAESRLALAGAAATTESDRSAFQLLSNEFNNMQQLSTNFNNLHTTLTFTPTNALDNNPLDAKILACARALASMAASGQFQDDPSCH